MCKYAISAICITLKSQLHILAEWCERKTGHLEMLFSPRNAFDIEKYLSTRLVPKADEVYEVFDAGRV